MPELYSDEPRPKTVRQMLQFQVFILHRYMRHVVDSYYKDRDHEDVLSDTRIYALILDCCSKSILTLLWHAQFDVAR